eukprot:281804-Rhodomonas_salina.1
MEEGDLDDIGEDHVHDQPAPSTQSLPSSVPGDAITTSSDALPSFCSHKPQPSTLFAGTARVYDTRCSTHTHRSLLRQSPSGIDPSSM